MGCKGVMVKTQVLRNRDWYVKRWKLIIMCDLLHAKVKKIHTQKRKKKRKTNKMTTEPTLIIVLVP